MMQSKSIQKLEKQHAKVCKKLLDLDEFGPGRKLFVIYKKKEIEIRKKINRFLTPYLEENDVEFKKIADQNYELLKDLSFELKTRTIGMSVFGYYSTSLEGEIHSNGVAYCSTNKTNFPIFKLLSSYQFPSKFAGRIDCLGNISLETVAVQSAFLKTVPDIFTGKIETNGRNIQVETSTCKSDITLSGKLFISQIVGNPFGKQADKKELFFSNKMKLEKILEEYRTQHFIQS